MPRSQRESQKEVEAELFRCLVDNVQDYAVFVVDPHGRVRTWNPGAERLLGYRESEIIDQPADLFFTPEDVAAGIPQQEMREALTGGAGNDDRWHVRKDGSLFWSGGMMTPLRDESGNLRGFAKIMRDRTEWRLSTDAAQEQARLAAFTRDVGLALIRADMLPDMLRHCAEAMVLHLDGAFARIWTFNTQDEVLELQASAGMYTHLDGPHSRVPLGQLKIGLIAQEKKPHLTNAVVGDPRVGDQEWAKREGMVAFAGYPLIVDDRIVGVMAMFARHTLSDATLAAMGSVANGIAVGIERKLAEDDRRVQQEWMSVTLASIGDAVIATDTHGRVTFLNEVAQGLTGWSQPDAQGQPLENVFNILDEQTRQRVENPVAKVLQEGRIVGLGNHTILVARDGTSRPIDDSAAPIRDSKGNLLGVVLVFRDVTDKRDAENQIRKSEARKRAILENALDSIITMDHDGNVVEFNPAAEQTFGYLREQVVGRPLAELIIPPSLRERHRHGLAHYHATGEGPVLRKRLELPALRADGTEFPVELAITRIPVDGLPLFTAYLRDITEQKRVEQHRNARLAVTHALAQAASSEEGIVGVLQAVCENLGWDVGFFWSVTADGTLLICHQAWHRSDVPIDGFETNSFSRTFRNGEGLPGEAWSTGRARWLLDVTNDARFPRAADAAEYGLHSAFACPVVVNDRTLGVVEFFTKRLREPDGGLLEMMETVAGGLGQFIERKQSEAHVRQSGQELADFFENATVGLHWVGPDGTVLRVNRAELQLLGYTREEYVGRPITDFHAEEDVICDILKRLKAGEELHEYPARLRCKDGSIKDVLIDSSVLFRNGQFVHTRCFTRDVTERKRAERLLTCQHRALEMVAEGRPLAQILEFLVRTVEGESRTGLVAAIHLLDQTGLYFRQAIAPSLPNAYHAATAISVQSDQRPCCQAASTCETVIVPDVTTDPRWAAFAELAVPLGLRASWSTPIISSEGNVLGTFANYYRRPGDASPQDRQLVEIVTRTAALAIERVRSREALHAREQVARFLADASATLADLTDFESTLQKIAGLAVPAFADWCAVDIREADGSVRRLAVTHSDPAKMQLAHELFRRYPPRPYDPHGVAAVLRTGESDWAAAIPDSLLVELAQDEEHLRLMRELGLKSYICAPLKSRTGTLGVLTFVTAESGRVYDADDRRAAEDLASRAVIAIENANLLTTLKEADRCKDEFLATLAHELRNPLAPIRNGLQVLRLAGGDCQMAEDARSMMERQLGQMVRLVDDLLDVSRITRNKLELRRQRVTLAAVVYSAVETSRPLIEQAGHTFSVSLPETPIYLDADPTRLAQVFSNLLNNAAKYTEPAGRISLTGEESGREVVVRVRDNGLGIPPEAIPHLFQMFSQVDRNLERAQGGLGIGLTLVRRLTEMHGGSIEARSDGLGRGSEFAVRLPILHGAAEWPDASATGEDALAGPKRRILVVDDNRDSAISLGMVLTLMGNETRTAYDGHAAVEVAHEFRPDIILLDIGLPKLNGYAVCRQIREQPWSTGVVIVALTGWGQEDDRRRSQEAGFDHHLVKPVELAALNTILKNATCL